MINYKKGTAIIEVKYVSARIGQAYRDEDQMWIFKSDKNRVWSEQMLKELSAMLKDLNK